MSGRRRKQAAEPENEPYRDTEASSSDAEEAQLDISESYAVVPSPNDESVLEDRLGHQMLESDALADLSLSDEYLTPFGNLSVTEGEKPRRKSPRLSARKTQLASSSAETTSDNDTGGKFEYKVIEVNMAPSDTRRTRDTDSESEIHSADEPMVIRLSRRKAAEHAIPASSSSGKAEANLDSKDEQDNRRATSKKRGRHSQPEEYMVETLVDYRTREGQEEYLVRWEGNAVPKETWEPLWHIPAELRRQFHDEHDDGDDAPRRKATKGRSAGTSASSSSSSSLSSLSPAPRRAAAGSSSTRTKRSVPATPGSASLTMDASSSAASSDSAAYPSEGLSFDSLRYNGPHGPTSAAEVPFLTCLNFLQLYFDSFLMTAICEYTNQSATFDGVDLQLQVSELWVYFAVVIFMSMDQMPQISDYWDKSTGHPTIRHFMSRHRFFRISKCLHFSDAESAPNPEAADYDPLYKVRTIVDHLNERFIACFDAGQTICVDESMQASKHRVGFIQYMPKKPTRWGIKMYTLCDALSAYLLKFIPYCGKKYAAVTGQTSPAVIAEKLVEPYHESSRTVYLDRHFTSIPLIKTLRENGLFAAGTIESNRTGIPAAMKVKRRKTKKNSDTSSQDSANSLSADNKASRGYYSTALVDGCITVGVFVDSAAVLFASSSHPPDAMTTVQRHLHRGGEPTTFNAPAFVGDQNSCSRAVDRFNQMNSAHPLGRRTFRWSLNLFWWMLGAAVTNATVLLKHALTAQKEVIPDRSTMIKDLARDIIAVYGGRYQKDKPVYARIHADYLFRISFLHPDIPELISDQQATSSSQKRHWAVRTNRSRHCTAKKCVNGGKRSGRTNFICHACDRPMCPDCLPNEHLGQWHESLLEHPLHIE